MGIINKIKLMANLTKRESKKVFDITKTNLKISAIEDDIINLYTKIGRIYFENHLNRAQTLTPPYKYIVNEIIEKQKAVKLLKQKVLDIKNPAGTFNIDKEVSQKNVDESHHNEKNKSGSDGSPSDNNAREGIPPQEEVNSGVFFQNVSNFPKEDSSSQSNDHNQTLNEREDKPRNTKNSPRSTFTGKPRNTGSHNTGHKSRNTSNAHEKINRNKEDRSSSEESHE